MDKREFLEIVLSFEFPLHSTSAFNPSIFTIEKFKSNEKDKKSLNKGLYLTLFLNILFSLAMYLANKKAGIIAFIVSMGVFLYYKKLIDA